MRTNPFRKGNLFHENDQEVPAPQSVVQELTRQLHNWRAHLPLVIAWDDQSTDDTAMSNSDREVYREATASLDPVLNGILDFRPVLNAALRTRYKYTEYIIWRPYIYTVLHSPLDSAKHDLECCRKAFKVGPQYSLTCAGI